MFVFAKILPLHCDIQTFIEYAVAPYVGAWIETCLFQIIVVTLHVAPYVGAWIETRDSGKDGFVVASHPTWVRGLKQPRRANAVRLCWSHPTWVRGLKQSDHPIAL